MSKKLSTIVMISLIGFLILGVGALVAVGSPANPPDEVIIENSGYKKDQKGHVKLSHSKHINEYKVACTECHHDYKDGKNVWTENDPVKKCAECHDPVKSKGKQKKLQLSYHSNCKDCHKLAVKEKKKAPTSKCNDCHAKK